MKHKNLFVSLSLALCLMTSQVSAGPISAKAAQLPDFVYQGRLEQSGAPANGNFDLSFSLWTDSVGGAQIGSSISEPGYPVVNGVFSINLAFPGAFTGEQTYLQV